MLTPGSHDLMTIDPDQENDQFGSLKVEKKQYSGNNPGSLALDAVEEMSEGTSSESEQSVSRNGNILERSYETSSDSSEGYTREDDNGGGVRKQHSADLTSPKSGDQTSFNPNALALKSN